jgi:Secretion system C-terminal sorting domain
MKKLILALVVFMPVFASAQFTSAPGNYLPAQHSSAAERNAPFWTMDFSQGIPVNWTNTEAGGVAHWEYRGPATSPDITAGSRGSCISEGTVGPPIASTTADNGFIIFDSNYWDNDTNPCTVENFGSGQAPGPHLAQLTTASINCSGHTHVALQFEQYIRYYLGETSVEMSVNGGAFTTVYTNVLEQGMTTVNPMLVRVPLPAEAGNTSDLKLRFVYNGLYYFWQIDDIKLIDNYDRDLVIDFATYGDFDTSDPTHATGFEMMEYTQYPPFLAPNLMLQASTFNFGTSNLTNVNLNASVKNIDTGTELVNITSTDSFTVPSGTAQNIVAGQFQMPGDLAHYACYFHTTQTEVDEDESNNMDTLHFRITPVTLARDKGPMTSVYVPTNAYLNAPFEVGNVFFMQTGGYVNSVSVGFAIGTNTNQSVHITIYPFSLSMGIGIPITTTTDFPLTNVIGNNFGQEYLSTFPLATPVYLSQGAYLVVVGSDAGLNEVNVALAGKSEDTSSWIKFNNTDLFYLTRIPQLRLNFGDFVNTSETTEHSFGIFPNPCKNKVTITSQFSGNSAVNIFSSTGQLVQKTSFTGMGNHDLDIQSLPVGVYQVQVINGDQSQSQSILVE